MPVLKKGTYKTVSGTHYGTPKELWGFRWRAPRAQPLDIAKRFLREEADLLGLDRIKYAPRPRVVRSLGATHVILQQTLEGLPIHRAYITVHISRDGDVYLVKNRVVPPEFREKKGSFQLTAAEAARRARAKVRGDSVQTSRPEPRWFPKEDKLCPAYRVHVLRRRPREEWITYVNASTGGILSHYDNLATQRPTAHVFNPNPVAAVPDWSKLKTGERIHRPPPESYVHVFLDGLRRGNVLDGRRVSTHLTPKRVRSRARRFEFLATQPGFLEAMVYHHLDRAIHYLETLGYRGRTAMFKGPIPVNAHGTREDNSWYSPTMRSLTFGTGGVDDAEDAEIILHEFGHALQDAICPGFGQSVQAAAMGEGFGDYLAASFFAAVKPKSLRDCVMSWDALAEENDPPCLRRMDGSLTFESFEHGDDASEHSNGSIWAATLWDIWKALGRDDADRIIIDSHFQLDAFTTLARGAHAIIDADENLNQGRHVPTLRRIFRRRGIGPVE